MSELIKEEGKKAFEILLIILGFLMLILLLGTIVIKFYFEYGY